MDQENKGSVFLNVLLSRESATAVIRAWATGEPGIDVMSQVGDSL